MKEYEFHEVANVFPLIEGEEFDKLAEDIRKHGLRDAITLHPDGRILDGRNRYRACVRVNVEPRFETWDGKGTEAEFVASKNLHRRNLTPSQLAMAAAKLANLIHGSNQYGSRVDLSGDKSTVAVNVERAAKVIGATVPHINRAKVVLKRGTPELVRAVETGKLTVSTAQVYAGTVPREVQDKSAKAGTLVEDARKAASDRYKEWEARKGDKCSAVDEQQPAADDEATPAQRGATLRKARALFAEFLEAFKKLHAACNRRTGYFNQMEVQEHMTRTGLVVERLEKCLS